jgi:hypothetical protein
MWICELKEVRQRRNRWHVEGAFLDRENQEKMDFSITIRFGWVALEAISGPLFQNVLRHFTEVLGDPRQPPTCSGASECQDDAVYLTTSWEVGEGFTELAALLAKLLRVPQDRLVELT